MPGPLLVSTCLTGLPARYNGARQANEELMDLLQGLVWAPVCPEQLGGLATPRPPSSLVGGDGFEVLAGRAAVIDPEGNDLTPAYLQGAAAVKELAARLKPPAVIFQARSPSCGSVVRSGSDSSVRPIGVAAAALLQAGVRIIEVWEQGLSTEASAFLSGLRASGK